MECHVYICLKENALLMVFWWSFFSMFPSFYSHKKRKDSAEEMILPRDGMRRHPSDLFPSFLIGTTKSQLKDWCKSEDKLRFWEQPSALGSRSDSESNSYRTRCSESDQAFSSGSPLLNSDDSKYIYKWWQIILLKPQCGPWNVSSITSLSWEPSNHPVSQVQIHKLWPKNWILKSFENQKILSKVHCKTYLALGLELNWCRFISSFYISFLVLISTLFAVKISTCLILGCCLRPCWGYYLFYSTILAC